MNVWDLRSFTSKTPVAVFKHHTKPVTTVEWHPTDSAVFASGGSDNQIAQWDLSVEKDQEAGAEEVEVELCEVVRLGNLIIFCRMCRLSYFLCTKDRWI